MRWSSRLLAALPSEAPAGPSGYQRIATLPLGGLGGWDYLTLDSATRRLFISRETRVIVLDVDRGKVVGEIPDTLGVHGIALAPELGRGFTSNGRSASVTIFDFKTLKRDRHASRPTRDPTPSSTTQRRGASLP